MFGLKDDSSQAEMSCFFFKYRPGPLGGLLVLFCIQKRLFSTDVDPWVGSWSCVNSKEALLRQKQAQDPSQRSSSV